MDNVLQLPALKPDLAAAENFLTLLDEERERWLFLAFADSEDQKGADLTCVIYDTPENAWPRLVELNRESLPG